LTSGVARASFGAATSGSAERSGRHRYVGLMGRLAGQVAVVTGATRGAGLGIARVLGEEGATVYVTGRSVRGAPTVPEYPGAIEDAADQVTARGGHGIPVRCDHTDEQAVDELFQQIGREQGRLDLLVCNAWAGYMPYPEHNDWFGQPFWEQSMERWDGMFTGGLRAHLLTARYGLPLMLPARRGLLVFTTFTMGRKYLGNVFYDVAKNGICRAAEVLASELEQHEIAALALTPGWVLAERMTDLTEQQRAQTESPEYIGRAIAALASDPGIVRRTGQTLAVGNLAREYGFTDIDGRQPTAYPIVR
jgi:NAD(P)-dependent dehydrogenase (short-subunit alcohol dehydrogenase family)